MGSAILMVTSIFRTLGTQLYMEWTSMWSKERNKNAYLNIQQDDYPKNDFTLF